MSEPSVIDLGQDRSSSTPRKPRRRVWVNGGLILLLGVLIAIKWFVIDLFVIPQNGMYPTLPAGKRFLAWRQPYDSVQDVKRGDIVLFHHEQDGTQYTYIWRVVGLPGESVHYTREEWSIDGQAVSREEVRHDGNFTIYLERHGDAAYEVAYQQVAPEESEPVQITVPEGEFFMLGDNRDNAADSRFMGTIRFEQIFGRK